MIYPGVSFACVLHSVIVELDIGCFLDNRRPTCNVIEGERNEAEDITPQ